MIIYDFLVKSKPHERIDLLITTSVNIYETKKSYSNENMLFSRKTDETIWKPPFLRSSSLSTNPPISEQFFHDPPLCRNFKNKSPAPPPNFRGEETMYIYVYIYEK